MKFLNTLASYVPGIIVEQLQSQQEQEVPFRKAYETVVVFCDISGFTKLSEHMARSGKGAEGVSRNLNKYFQMMVKIISSGGGDVLKFAGDAMIVLWPDDSADGIVDRLQRAAQCAVYIQQKLDQATIEDSVQLSVKIGIGVGMVSVIHIGGTHKRMEYLAVGDPLIQAFHAEHHAVPGQVLASPQVWNLLKDLPGTFTAAKISEDGFVSLCVHTPFAPVRQRRHKPFLSDGTGDEAHHHHHPLLEQRIRSYVPNSVLPMLLKASYEDDMKWANETRRVAVMFVNLGLEEHNMLAAGDVRQRDAMVQVHNVLVGVQKAVYHYEGSVNKFLMDDKGSTLIACFGLSPVSHTDDALRAVLSALYICERLFDLSFPASVGITVGDVFCGVVGSTTRREYTVLGDSVNLAARLMQKACTMADSGRPTGGVIIDEVCRNECMGLLEFQTLEPIEVKGKSGRIKIFHPFPKGYDPALLRAPMHSMDAPPRNIFREIHLQQLRNVEAHKALKLHLAAASWARKQQAAVVSMRAPGRSFTPYDGPGASAGSSSSSAAAAAAEEASQHFVAAVYQGTVEPPASQRLAPSGVGEQHGVEAAAGGGGSSGDGNGSIRNGNLTGSASPGGSANGKKEGGYFKTFTRSVSTLSVATSSGNSGGGNNSTRGSVMGMGRMGARGSTMGNRRGSSTGVGMVGSVAGGGVIQGELAFVVKAHPLQAALRAKRPHLPIKSVSISVPPPGHFVGDGADGSDVISAQLSLIHLHDTPTLWALLQASHASAKAASLLEPPPLLLVGRTARSASNYTSTSIPSTAAIAEDEEEEASNGGVSKSENRAIDGPDKYWLHVVGTSCFLPRSDKIGVEWLHAFVCAAHGLPTTTAGSAQGTHFLDYACQQTGAGNMPKLQLVHEATALNVQSRVSKARQALLERQARLGPRSSSSSSSSSGGHRRHNNNSSPTAAAATGAGASSPSTSGEGSMVIIEGDPGCGKSMLLAHFLTRATLRPDPTGPQATAAASHSRSEADLDEDEDEGGGGDESDPSRAAPPFFVTAASPFHTRPFGVWCTILQQWLDFVAAAEKKKGKLSQNKSQEQLEAANLNAANNSDNASRREANSAAEAGRQARTTLCLELLPHSLRAAHAWRLNALVGVDCEAVRLRSRTTTTSAGSSGSSGNGNSDGTESLAQFHKASLVVLYALVQALSKRCSAVLVIDDAHVLDPESWSLAHALATGPPSFQANSSSSGDDDNDDDDENGDVSSSSHAAPSEPTVINAMPRLLLVIAMRPMVTYGPNFRRIAPDYEALAALSDSQPETVIRLKLDGLPPDEISSLVLAQFGTHVKFVGERLLAALEELCRGNPQCVVELLRRAKAASPPVLVFTSLVASEHDNAASGSQGNSQAAEMRQRNADKEGDFSDQWLLVDLAESCTVADWRLTTPRSIIAKVFTEKIDKCTPAQTLLLKTASSVTTFFHRKFEEGGKLEKEEGLGATFKLSYVEACHPVSAHLPHLLEDVNILMEKGLLVDVAQDSILAPTATHTVAKDQEGDRKLRFAHGILAVKHLQLMCLKGQQQELRNRVKKHHDMLDEQSRMNFMLKARAALGETSELKKGLLRIRKIDDPGRSMFQPLKRYVEGGDWKERFCKLQGGKLFMYKRESDEAHTQVLNLAGGVVELEPHGVYDRHTFRVEVPSYTKEKKEYVDEGRPFIFSSALDPDKTPDSELMRDVDDWHFMFKFALESSSLKTAQARKSALPGSVSGSGLLGNGGSSVGGAASGSSSSSAGGGGSGRPASLKVLMNERSQELRKNKASAGFEPGSANQLGANGAKASSSQRRIGAAAAATAAAAAAAAASVTGADAGAAAPGLAPGLAETVATTTEGGGVNGGILAVKGRGLLDGPDAAAELAAMIAENMDNHHHSSLSEKGDGSNGSNGRSSKSSSGLSAEATAEDTELATEEDDDAVDSRLLLRVQGCQGLTNPNVHGYCNPFCRVVLDAKVVESRCCGDTTASPEWRKTFHVPVAVAQWSRSHLKLEVWNREAFLTDDFLGHVVLPLKDMLPEAWDENAIVRDDQLKEVALEPRYPGERVCGSLVFGATLIMSPRTTERSARAGGVASLQTEADAELAKKAAARQAAMKGKREAQRKAKARAEAAAAAEAQAAAAQAADAARASEYGNHGSGGGASGVGTDMAALSGTALGSVESAARRLKQTLHAVECQALPTLPAPGTKGVDRAWVHGELSDVRDALSSIVQQGTGNRAGAVVAPGRRGSDRSAGSSSEDRRRSSMDGSDSGRGGNGNGVLGSPLGVGGGSATGSNKMEKRILGQATVADIAKGSALDLEQQQWLSSQYSRNDADSSTASTSSSTAGGAGSAGAKSSTAAGRMSRVASLSAPLGRLIRGSSGSSLTKNGNGSGNSAALSADAAVFWFERGSSEDDEVVSSTTTAAVARNSSGGGGSSSASGPLILGPFNAHQMLAAYRAGYLKGPNCVVHQASAEAAGAAAAPSASPLPPPPPSSSEKPQLWKAAKDVLSVVQYAVNAAGDEAGLLWADQPLPIDGPAADFRLWDFNLWAVPTRYLDRLVLEMLQELGCVEAFGLDPLVLKRFLHRIDVGMTLHGQRYHNRFHSFDVAHACFVMSMRFEASDLLGHLELLSLMIAALGHDLEHPGYNNAFCVNALTPLALTYSDQSPLENHHLAVLWSILRSSGCELFEPLANDHLRTARKLTIATILATDMTFHFSLKSELDGVLLRNHPANASDGSGSSSGSSSSGSSSSSGAVAEVKALESDLDRLVLLKVVLHVADISNPCKRWEVGKLWSDRVLDEFFAQGDAEKAMDLPRTPNMDRDTTKQAELSVNFVDFIVGPFFMALTELLPRMHECCALMQDNRAAWTAIVVKDLEARSDLDEAKKQEDIGKWTSREVGFNGTCAPLIAKAKAVLGSNGGATGKAGSGQGRRTSMSFMEDMAARTKEASQSGAASRNENSKTAAQVELDRESEGGEGHSQGGLSL